jgi:hypothetical protein
VLGDVVGNAELYFHRRQFITSRLTTDGGVADCRLRDIFLLAFMCEPEA